MEISKFQSLLQFFAAIYLVVEWVSLDRILGHYKNSHISEFKYRIRRFKKYSTDLQDIWSDYSREGNVLISTYDIDKNYSFFRKLCFLYFIICFIGLVVTSFFGEVEMPTWQLTIFLVVLCLPFLYVLVRLVNPIRNEFRVNKEIIEEFLEPLEKLDKEFRDANSYPRRIDAVKKRRAGDPDALTKYREALKTYNENYDLHMKNSL